MPIRAPAARALARSILVGRGDDLTELEVNLAASLIVTAVARDEMMGRALRAETRLALADTPDSLGG